MKVMYIVRVEHDGDYTDEELELLVRRGVSGAGTDLMSGRRDMEWEFKTRRGATNAFTKLSRKRKLSGLTMEKDYYSE